jgi:hypothetical protein
VQLVGPPTTRIQETNLGNLVCDTMVASINALPDFVAKFGETFICIQNGKWASESIYHHIWGLVRALIIPYGA